MMTILLILGIIILLLWIIWLVLSGGDEMPTVKTFKKSSKHSNTSQLKAEAKFDCQCGEKNIKLKNNGEEYICQCGIKYRIYCHVEMEVDLDVNYEHSIDLCELCKVSIFDCVNPDKPYKLTWVAEDPEPILQPNEPEGR
jgi:hypothetical protein